MNGFSSRTNKSDAVVRWRQCGSASICGDIRLLPADCRMLVSAAVSPHCTLPSWAIPVQLKNAECTTAAFRRQPVCPIVLSDETQRDISSPSVGPPNPSDGLQYSTAANGKLIATLSRWRRNSTTRGSGRQCCSSGLQWTHHFGPPCHCCAGGGGATLLVAAGSTAEQSAADGVAAGTAYKVCALT